MEFEVNNKTYSATKVFLFIENYGKELRIGTDIRRKGKVEKVIKFVERIKKMQKEVEAALRKTQEEMKLQADKRIREVEEWKKRDKMILSTKDLVLKKRLTKKLVD